VVRRLLRRAECTARNDNLCASGKKPRARFVGERLFAIKRFVDDFCEAKITFPYETSFCKFFCFFLSVYFVHVGFLKRVFYETV
jgi:hypothetical protein